MTNLSTLTSEQLRRAAGIKDQIARLEKQLASLLGSSAPAAKRVGAPKGRKMSAAARAKIAKAAKARWAKAKAAGKNTL